GGKAVLYELFSFNPPSLRLYADICAHSPYLSGILVNNPGMLDELLDSLILDQPRTADELRAELAELLRGASDPEPILRSFQDKELRSEEHTSELQSQSNLVCRLLLEKKK